MLSEVRKEKGITQLELSKKSGVGQGLISRIESGSSGLTTGMARRLASPLGTDWRELYLSHNISMREKLKNLFADVAAKSRDGGGLTAKDIENFEKEDIAELLRVFHLFVENAKEGELPEEFMDLAEKFIAAVLEWKAENPALKSRDNLDFGDRDAFGRAKRTDRPEVAAKSRDGLAEQNRQTRERKKMEKEKFRGLDYGNRDKYGRRIKKPKWQQSEINRNTYE